jgi:hypothetical protein
MAWFPAPFAIVQICIIIPLDSTKNFFNHHLKLALQKLVARVFTEFRPGAAERDSVANQLVVKRADRYKRMGSILGHDRPAEAQAHRQFDLIYRQVSVLCQFTPRVNGTDYELVAQYDDWYIQNPAKLGDSK